MLSVIPIPSFIEAGILKAEFPSNKSFVWHFIHKSFMIKDFFFWGLVTHSSDWSFFSITYFLLFYQPRIFGHDVGTAAVHNDAFKGSFIFLGSLSLLIKALCSGFKTVGTVKKRFQKGFIQHNHNFHGLLIINIDVYWAFQAFPSESDSFNLLMTTESEVLSVLWKRKTDGLFVQYYDYWAWRCELELTLTAHHWGLKVNAYFPKTTPTDRL